MSVVCFERGLLWTWWSVMDVVCYELVCFGVVCYECGLLWTWFAM